MKKQLLFTIAFLASITFASAQNSLATVTNALDTETFLFGTSQFLNDPAIAVLTAGTGSVGTNGAFFSILGDKVNEDAQGTFTFTLKTAGSNLTSNLSFLLTARKGNNASGYISIAGYADTPFEYVSDGTTSQGTIDFVRTFGSAVTLSSTPLTVKITMTSLKNGTVTTIHDPTLRINNVAVEKTATLSTNSFDLKSFQVFPNPTADSFQISTEETIKSVILTNATGQVVKTFTSSENYNISDLNAGIYFATVSSDNGSQTVKIVKK